MHVHIHNLGKLKGQWQNHEGAEEMIHNANKRTWINMYSI